MTHKLNDIRDAKKRKKSLWKNKKPAPISYLGGKRRELFIIDNYKPDNFDKFVDCFCGGASIGFYYSQEGYKTHLNDLYEEQIKFLKLLKDGGDELDKLIEGYKKIDFTDEEYFYKVFKNEIKMDKVLRYIYLKSSCKRGDERRGLFGKSIDKKTGEYVIDKRNGISKMEKFKEYHKVMKNMTITLNDYKEVMEKYKEDQNAWLYLDPPYVSTKADQYGIEFKAENLDYIKDFMDTSKCKVMLHIDFTGHTYHLFKDYLKYYYPISYALAKIKKNNIYQRYHCIITNY